MLCESIRTLQMHVLSKQVAEYLYSDYLPEQD